MSDTEALSKPMCPLLTTVQIVPRGFTAHVIPIGEAEVGGGASLVQQIQASKPGGGFSVPALSMKKVVVYEVKAGFALRSPEGTKQNDPDPDLVAETLVVPCQEDGCKFWSGKQRDCRLVSGNK